MKTYGKIKFLISAMHKFLYIYILLFFISCTPQENKVEQAQSNTKLLSPVTFEITSGIKIKEVKIDSTSKDYSCSGIRITFVAEASEEIFITLAEQDFSSLYINTMLLVDDKAIFSKIEKIKSNYGKQVKLNKGSFFSSPGEHFLETVIPYFLLGLPSGEVSSKLVVEVYPAKFLNEADLHDYGKLEYISNTSIGKQSFDYKFNAPDLHKGKLTVKSFEIKASDEKKGKFDFSIIGKGLPDPYWQIQCGEEVIYISQPVKNTKKFTSVSSTEKFYYSDNDIFTITVFDFDQGPFNKKDIIGSWSGTIKELNNTKMLSEFGRVQNFNYQFEK